VTTRPDLWPKLEIQLLLDKDDEPWLWTIAFECGHGRKEFGMVSLSVRATPKEREYVEGLLSNHARRFPCSCASKFRQDRLR
jgi:hypothetical protein